MKNRPCRCSRELRKHGREGLPHDRIVEKLGAVLFVVLIELENALPIGAIIRDRGRAAAKAVEKAWVLFSFCF